MSENNYPMPALTAQERADLIERYTEKESDLCRSIDRCDAIGCASSLVIYQLDLKAVRVTLAALTAEKRHVGALDDHGNEYSLEFYTAPPVPVLTEPRTLYTCDDCGAESLDEHETYCHCCGDKRTWSESLLYPEVKP